MAQIERRVEADEMEPGTTEDDAVMTERVERGVLQTHEHRGRRRIQ